MTLAVENKILKSKMFPQNPFRSPRLWLSFFTIAWLLTTAQYAAADAQDTFNVTFATNITYDSNLFRLSDNISPPFVGPKRSDLIFISSATVGIRKHFGMQRLEASGIFVDNRYENHDFLNFFAKNYNAGWAWYLTPYFHGNLRTIHSEALNNFANLTGFLSNTSRNVRTSDNHRFDGVFEVTPSWHIVGGISEQVSKNSILATADFNNRILSFEGGLRYTTAAGNSLTYTARSGVGEFMNRPAPIVSSQFDTRFNDMEHELRVAWRPTVKTSVDGRVAHFQRKHAHFSERNFSGFVGNLNLNWAITEKTRITTGWSRDLFNYQTSATFLFPGFGQFSSSYALDNRFFVMPIWQISAKTAIRLRYEYLMRDFHGAVIAVPSSRSDSQHSGMIAFDWQPLTMLSLSGELRREHRSSNLFGFDYNASAGSIIAKLNF